jgi:hypothetical protein
MTSAGDSARCIDANPPHNDAVNDKTPSDRTGWRFFLPAVFALLRDTASTADHNYRLHLHTSTAIFYNSLLHKP